MCSNIVAKGLTPLVKISNNTSISWKNVNSYTSVSEKNMLIPVAMCEANSMTLVDLHGKLKYFNEQPKVSKIGEMSRKIDNDIFLAFGSHILEGRETSGEKPLLMLEKIVSSKSESDNKLIMYRVNAIVKKRLVFRSRPKPIIINVPKF